MFKKERESLSMKVAKYESEIFESKKKLSTVKKQLSKLDKLEAEMKDMEKTEPNSEPEKEETNLHPTPLPDAISAKPEKQEKSKK